MASRPAPEFLVAFEDHEREVRVRNSKVAHAMLVVLVPVGSTLDWWVYPSIARELLGVRLLVAALAAAALALHFTPWARRQIHWFAMISPLLVNASISWMVFRSEGA